MSHTKILIVGAGPTGLSAALELSRHGLFPTIIEKRSGPSELSRAVGIMPATLSKLGERISIRIREEGIPFYKINVHLEGQLKLSTDLSGQIPREKVICGLPQNRTEEILREELALRDIEVLYGHELKSIENSDNGVLVRINDQKTSKSFDWLIACDGKPSFVRSILGIDYHGYDVEGLWSIADVKLESKYDFSAINVWMKDKHDGQAVISLPIGQGRVRIISTSEGCLELIPVDFKVKETFREGVFQVSARQVSEYVHGRVVLAGDAAHCHSPVGGKGMNLGIDDAIAAARHIAKGSMEGYTSERKKMARAVIRESERRRKAILSQNSLQKFFVSFFLGLINRSEIIQKRLLHSISKLR